MSFVDPAFLPLLALLLATYPWLDRGSQNVLLVLVSLVFYGWVHPWLIALLLGAGLLAHATGWAIELDRARSRLWVGIALVGNLGVLALFKYLGFFRDNVVALAAGLGLDLHLGTLDLLLPAGLSFYTFQLLGYTLDVARQRTSGRRNLLDMMVFATFFPQLVAGPIERADTLLRQVERARIVDRARLAAGARLALWGAVQKLVVADSLAVFVDRIFALREAPAVLVWAGTLAFAVQLLADFAGYTDLARGLAHMLGFDLSMNFRAPYLASGPVDFWRRWHITLGRWFRDHVYGPLRGQDAGLVRTLVAGWATFLLSGLWHGAAWTFVLWGAWHATGWSVERTLRHLAPGAHLPRPVAVAATFVFTVVGWLIFREHDLGRLAHHLAQVPWAGDAHARVAAAVVIGTTALFALPLLLAPWVRARTRSPIARTAWGAAAVAALLSFGGPDPRAFVYFAF